MDVILLHLSAGLQQLFERANGPLYFRLVVMPTVVSIIAIRAGLRDAREGQPAFLWGMPFDPAERRRHLLSGWKDITRIFIVALVLDTVYQLVVLRAVYLWQVLAVAVVCVILPYAVFRGPTAWIARNLHKNMVGPTSGSTGGPGAGAA
jgi:hypothetical protein